MINQNTLTKALKDIRPNAEWSLTGDSLDGLEWLDKTQSQPTLLEIETAIANPLPEPEPTVEEKLASVGLSIDDLKSALGLGDN
jgi:hypothetical protein